MAAPAQITMVRVSEFDKVFNDAQRQGRISFYLTGRGEEACSVASAAALGDEDFILPQYRELGAAFWRGFTFEDTANQLCSNSLDPAKGRQLPLHIGDRSKRFFYVKSTLGTQRPAALTRAPRRSRAVRACVPCVPACLRAVRACGAGPLAYGTCGAPTAHRALRLGQTYRAHRRHRDAVALHCATASHHCGTAGARMPWGRPRHSG